ESAAQGSAMQLNALTQRLARMGDRPARRAALC
ncbi:MAG TPA: transcriptional regulator, partial [Halomonas sp.]|nr:transcriptional regulator [Halomonas sp.]